MKVRYIKTSAFWNRFMSCSKKTLWILSIIFLKKSSSFIIYNITDHDFLLTLDNQNPLGCMIKS